MAPDALTRRVALPVDVDALAEGVATEVHGSGSVGDAELLGELLELLGVAVVVVGVVVAHHAHGLARVGPADRGLVLPAGQERVLVAEDARGPRAWR